jgi:formiminotetrahydrofolate cyclodeaminase
VTAGDLHGEPIGAWLDRLASDAPAPGGGAAAALEAATAAALLEMVCNLTIGKPAYAEVEDAVTAIRDRATALRSRALGLAAEDADAFAAVIDAYRLPRESDEERALRHERIQSALGHAAEVPRRTAATAAELLDLAESLVPIGNATVISDAAASAAVARAALQTALGNVEANRIAISDPTMREELEASEKAIERELMRADVIVRSVLERMTG